MQLLAGMYISLFPVIFAGSANMLFCKLPILDALRHPLDNRQLWKDKERIFGDNKTWKGLFGMILFSCVATVLWGLLCARIPYMNSNNFLYYRYENTWFFNLSVGFFLGLAYALFELPNSFLKRRLRVEPGKRIGGLKGLLLVVLDQSDSIIGCVLVIAFLYPLTPLIFLLYVCVGAATHIVVNMILYALKLRKNMF